MPSSIYLVTGGARSGKSSHAEKLCESLCSNPIYIATAPNPGNNDSDFAQRIQRHKDTRQGRNWTTMEEPLFPSKHVETFSKRVVLVDCLTLWLTNFMEKEGAFTSSSGDNNDNQNDQDISKAADQALENIKQEFDQLTQPWDVTYVFVTNELGSGTHGESHLTRKFVDAQGWFNQHVAAQAQRVIHMVCGIPNVLKNTVRDNIVVNNSNNGNSNATAAIQQAQMVDKYLSSRHTPMDPKGYFLVKIDDASQTIVASFHSCIVNDQGEVCDLQGKKIPCCGDDAKKNRPEPMKVWTCRTAKELTTEIFERWQDLPKAELSAGHAAYIGREAQRAEQCLYSGAPYQQD